MWKTKGRLGADRWIYHCVFQNVHAVTFQTPGKLQITIVSLSVHVPDVQTVWRHQSQSIRRPVKSLTLQTLMKGKTRLDPTVSMLWMQSLSETSSQMCKMLENSSLTVSQNINLVTLHTLVDKKSCRQSVSAVTVQQPLNSLLRLTGKF